MKWLVKRDQIMIVDAESEKEALSFAAEQNFNATIILTEEKAVKLNLLIKQIGRQDS